MNINTKNNKVSQEELFEKMPVYRAIMTLTIPIIISSVISIVYNLSDTYFVGMLNDPIQNAAVTLAAPAMTLFFAVTNLFGVGASSLMSRALGTKDYETVKKASATGLFFGLFFAILLSVITTTRNSQVLAILGTKELTYAATHDYMFWTVCLGAVPGIMTILFSFMFRAEGRSLQASVGAISGCVLNIILDPFFILPWGLNMGAAGAGLATFISNCVSCVYFLILIFLMRGKTFVSVNIRHIAVSRGVLGDVCAVGVPGVFQNILNVISMTILNNIAAGFGENVVASIGIANKVNQLPIQIIFGFSGGVMPLIGYNFASGNKVRMREVIRKTFIISISALTVVLVAFNLCGQPIVRLFMDNDEIVSIGARFLSGFGISLPFMCVDFVVVGISQSFGKGMPALIFSFLRKVFLEIPLILLFSSMWGIYGMAYAQCASEVVMCFVAAVLLKSLLKEEK